MGNFFVWIVIPVLILKSGLEPATCGWLLGGYFALYVAWNAWRAWSSDSSTPILFNEVVTEHADSFDYDDYDDVDAYYADMAEKEAAEDRANEWSWHEVANEEERDRHQ